MRHLARQQADTAPALGTNTRIIVIVLVVIVAVLVFSIVFYIWHFNRRAGAIRCKYGETESKSWRDKIRSFGSVFSVIHPVAMQTHHRDSTASDLGRHQTQEAVEAGFGLDRNTSIRSTMTLPTYSAVPRDNEDVLGREGERAGMDTVVEHPETNEEEEVRRDAEMESLYRIRQARRREQEERQDRRRRRREARQRGDMETLAAVRREARQAAREREINGSDALILQHERRPRSRRVSAVSYGDLGVARHDGTRLRANSGESERPLLDATAALGMSSPLRPWLSNETNNGDSTNPVHRRQISSTTDLSVVSYGTEEDDEDDEDDNESALSDGGDSTRAPTIRSPARARARSATARTLSRPRSAHHLTTTTSRASSHTRGALLNINTDLPTSADQPPPPYTSPDTYRRRQSAPVVTFPAAAAAVAASSSTRPATSAGDSSLPPPPPPPLSSLPGIQIVADTPVAERGSGEGWDPLRRPSVPNFSHRRDSWTVVMNAAVSTSPGSGEGAREP